ncbi:LOW QUALITY PROTEIN: carcinoembryonic antigen-related cell adhesion molecule 5-like [Myotis myotis]|uniref:LOW QUALITY PROTEIN: carcinoembryonic antigen-related cell adhesion molecule 5-like n=1 Tax=Myotis myotis TaxID=51298 RepID=UPI00174A7FE5|nr:LOW QUALITY PROTEIN: carcinoembryonic antigen-related cell adhesion molecule 5-like [Myotis myotis]
MESPSAPAHRGLGLCQGLLLAASLLTFWSLPSTAQLTIESVPPNAAEGKDVLLRVHNLPGDLRGYTWYKGEKVDSDHQIVSYVIDTQKITYGPAYSDREKIYPNGSLLFQNVTRKDTGYYILLATDKNFQSKQVTGQLRVYTELPKPSITSSNSHPEEHKDPVVLTCEPRTQDTTYLWLINSQSITNSARLQLSKDNRTLTLLPVTRKDTGPYECETRNPVSAGRSDPFTLNVVYGPDAPIISPSDSHYLRGTNLKLSCQAASHPPAQYSWLINGRPQQPTQELFIRNVTSNDSGSYTCLAHNSVTGLNRTTVKTITISAELPKPSITSNISNPEEYKDPVMLTCEPQIQGITYMWLVSSQKLQASARLQLSKDNRTLTLLPVTRNDMGPYECEIRNPVSAGRSDPFTLNVFYSPDAPLISPSDSYYLPGANLSLFCLSTSNPPTEYSWLVNGRPQQPTQKLFIPNITAHDTGSYTCLTHNSVTGLNRTTVKTITVSGKLGKPSIRASNATVTEHKDAVVLTCLTNDMEISIRWLFKNQILPHKDRMKLSWDNNILTIDPVRREDTGGYQCEVFKLIRSSKSESLRLDVQRK